MPLARLDWRKHDQEDRTVRRMVAIASDELSRLELTQPAWQEWVSQDNRTPAQLTDTAHPTGSTRMSVDPREGVVGTDCRVHDVANLYVVGSSIFPTTGHANPTQTVVAFAVRLADQLKRAI